MTYEDARKSNSHGGVRWWYTGTSWYVNEEDWLNSTHFFAVVNEHEELADFPQLPPQLLHLAKRLHVVLARPTQLIALLDARKEQTQVHRENVTESSA